MRNFLGFIILLVAALLQVTLITHFAVLGIVPNLVLAILLIWAFCRPPEESIIWALMGGLFLDLFSVSPFGIYTLLCVGITFAVSFTKQNYISDINSFFKVITGLVALIIFNFGFFLLSQIFFWIHLQTTPLKIIDYFFKLTPLEVCYSIILFIILLKPIEKFNEWVSHYEFTTKIPTRAK